MLGCFVHSITLNSEKKASVDIGGLATDGSDNPTGRVKSSDREFSTMRKNLTLLAAVSALAALGAGYLYSSGAKAVAAKGHLP